MADAVSNPDRPVRVRIAPSPTGNCHVGTARNSLYNLLFARQNGGKFILRIDDTDQKRSTQESEQGVLEGLLWLGLQWDEGPDVGGDFGPYRQSKRQDLYREHAQRLLDEGKAYYCFCTPEELQQEREVAQAAGELFKYSGRCRHLTATEIEGKRQANLPAVVRLRIVSKLMHYVDLVQGRIEQDAAFISDPIIVKSSGMPTYNFATVVDEIEMQISHVFRSGEHINNTFPQLQMYEALGFEPPEFGHIGLLLNPDRTKISKRTGAVYIGEFRDEGYLPEAMINHLALSGWNTGTEEDILDFDRLLEVFSLDGIGKANAIFDRPKLLHLNGHYIRQLTVGDLARRVLPFLQKAGLLPDENPDAATFERLQGIMVLEQERLTTLADGPEKVAFFFQDPDPAVSKALLGTNKFAKKHTYAELRDALTQARVALEALNEWSAAALHDLLDEVGQQIGWKRGPFLMPVRIVISGREATPSLFETMEFVGKEATLRRLDAVTALLPMGETIP